MDAAAAVTALSAVAHAHRLAVYRLLVERGPAGLPAGAIAERLHLAPSSLTFHLQHLQRARLLTQQRVGRQLYYAADFGAMRALIAYLTDHCCTGAAGAAACGATGTRASPPAATAAKAR
jgi:ArsR family transcriptional regulator, arsenate/arsenite/antimonite-responsive transcriptional repressor